MDNKTLIKSAFEAREKSYSPYSNFKVGAALLTREGKVFLGCNVENAGYTSTICAERTAIVKAVSEGYRDFLKIAIVGSKDGTYPCGVCRQTMREFNKDLEIVIARSESDYEEYTLEEIFPNSFGPDDLDKR